MGIGKEIGVRSKWYKMKSYEARVRFRVRVRVQNSAIFEKVGCGCGD